MIGFFGQPLTGRGHTVQDLLFRQALAVSALSV